MHISTFAIIYVQLQTNAKKEFCYLGMTPGAWGSPDGRCIVPELSDIASDRFAYQYRTQVALWSRHIHRLSLHILISGNDKKFHQWKYYSYLTPLWYVM